MAKQTKKKKKAAKRGSTPKSRKKETLVKEPLWVECPICRGKGTMFEGWQDAPDDNRCLLCDGSGEVLKQVLDMQAEVLCPECAGTGTEYVAVWSDDPEDVEQCLKCSGSGNILRVQLETEIKCEKWEQRTAQLPTKEERDLAEYLTTILPVTLDQADAVVCSLVSAVNARNNYEKSWLEYEG